MYTKEKIGTELKEKINQELDYADMSKWALDVYLTDVAANDAELDSVLSTLMMMDQGPEFELSHKKLTEIANILIVGDSPIYTRQRFGKELQDKIENRADVANIADWAYNVWMWKDITDDTIFKDIAYRLSMMCCDECFEYSYEELDEIADRLIAGEEVKL